MTDREAYPTAWITLAVLVLLYLLWRFALGAPTVSRCWVWEHWHIYCPGCGGTRALAELLKLHIVKSFLYNPMVLYFAVCAALLAAGRLLPRMTGGRVRIPYSHGYAVAAVVLAAGNFVVKNYFAVCRGVDVMAWIEGL